MIVEPLGLRGVALLRGDAPPRRAGLPPQGARRRGGARRTASTSGVAEVVTHRQRGGRDHPRDALPGGAGRGGQDAVGHRRRACSTSSSTSGPTSRPTASGSRVDLAASDDVALHVPAGLAHGYQTLEDDTRLTYLISASHSPEPRAHPAVGRPDRRHRVAAASRPASRRRTARGTRGRPRTDHRGVRADRRAGSCTTGTTPGDAAAGRATPTSTCSCPARPPTSSPGRAPAQVVHLAWSASGRAGLPHLRRQRALGRRHPRAGRGGPCRRAPACG